MLLESDGLPVQVVCCDAGHRLPEHLSGVHLQLQLVGPRVHQVPWPHPRTSQGGLPVVNLWRILLAVTYNTFKNKVTVYSEMSQYTCRVIPCLGSLSAWWKIVLLLMSPAGCFLFSCGSCHHFGFYQIISFCDRDNIRLFSLLSRDTYVNITTAKGCYVYSTLVGCWTCDLLIMSNSLTIYVNILPECHVAYILHSWKLPSHTCTCHSR